MSRDGARVPADLRVRPHQRVAVRNRLDAVGLVCAEAVAEVIAEDTGLTDEDASLLGMALTGLAQVSARHWLAQGSDVPKDEAARLVGALAWRGLGWLPQGGRGRFLPDCPAR